MGRSPWPDSHAGFAAGAIAQAALDVADRVGAARFAVWGSSAGCAPSIVLAAEHPDRVEALVLSRRLARGLERLAGVAVRARRAGP